MKRTKKLDKREKANEKISYIQDQPTQNFRTMENPIYVLLVQCLIKICTSIKYFDKIRL